MAAAAAEPAGNAGSPRDSLMRALRDVGRAARAQRDPGPAVGRAVAALASLEAQDDESLMGELEACVAAFLLECVKGRGEILDDELGQLPVKKRRRFLKMLAIGSEEGEEEQEEEEEEEEEEEDEGDTPDTWDEHGWIAAAEDAPWVTGSHLTALRRAGISAQLRSARLLVAKPNERMGNPADIMLVAISPIVRAMEEELAEAPLLLDAVELLHAIIKGNDQNGGATPFMESACIGSSVKDGAPRALVAALRAHRDNALLQEAGMRYAAHLSHVGREMACVALLDAGILGAVATAVDRHAGDPDVVYWSAACASHAIQFSGFVPGRTAAAKVGLGPALRVLRNSLEGRSFKTIRTFGGGVDVIGEVDEALMAAGDVKPGEHYARQFFCARSGCSMSAARRGPLSGRWNSLRCGCDLSYCTVRCRRRHMDGGHVAECECCNKECPSLAVPRFLRSEEEEKAAAAAKKKLLLCTKCRSVVYCSKACQKAAWPKHKEQCRPAPSRVAKPSSTA